MTGIHGGTMQVKGRGKIVMRTGDYHVTLHNVYYVPEMDANIMSEIRLEQKGFRIVSENGRRQVIDPKKRRRFHHSSLEQPKQNV